MTSIDRFVTGLILFVLVLFTTREVRAESWDAVDKVMFVSFVGLQIVDTAQTNYIHQHTDRYYETNPVFGKDPNMASVIACKTAATGLLYVVANMVPSVERKIILGGAIVYEASIVSHNYHIGIKMAW